MHHRRQTASVSIAELAAVLVNHPRRWLAPMGFVTLLGLFYALFLHQRPWEATQSLVLRDEAVGSIVRPGKFTDLDSMKTALETVQELARSRAVIVAALQATGMSAPTEKDVEQLRRAIRITAPNGAEFGKTEVFVLRVKHKKRDHAVAVAKALTTHLDERLRELRNRKAESLVHELTNSVRLAQDDLDETTRELAQLETGVGIDLNELRSLIDQHTNDGNLRQAVLQIQAELRREAQVEQVKQKLLEQLTTLRDHPNQLLATPNELLESQPQLRRLKDGLIDAQLRLAQLQGDMSDQHPKVRAAREALVEIQRRLRTEVMQGIHVLNAELQLSRTRTKTLEQQLAQSAKQVGGLATVRARYENVVNEMKQKTETLKLAQQKLADARASHAASLTASQLTRLDEPVTGDTPTGPGRLTILLGSMLGGLAMGLGILFLTITPVQPAPVLRRRPRLGRTIITNGDPRALRGLSFKRALLLITDENE